MTIHDYAAEAELWSTLLVNFVAIGTGIQVLWRYARKLPVKGEQVVNAALFTFSMLMVSSIVFVIGAIGEAVLGHPEFALSPLMPFAVFFAGAAAVLSYKTREQEISEWWKNRRHKRRHR